MKRFLAVVCLALALPATVSARPARIITPSSGGGIAHLVTIFLSNLWTHWRILPLDGGASIPPPH